MISCFISSIWTQFVMKIKCKYLLVAKPWRGGLANYVFRALEELYPGEVFWLESHPRTMVQKGKFLNQAGDAFKHLHAVSTGSFKSYTLSEDGIINITGFYFPGEIIGLDAINTGEHNNFVKALETSGVCALPFDMVDNLSGDMPALRKQLMKIMSKAIVDGTEKRQSSCPISVVCKLLLCSFVFIFISPIDIFPIRLSILVNRF